MHVVAVFSTTGRIQQYVEKAASSDIFLQAAGDPALLFRAPEPRRPHGERRGGQVL